MSLVVQFTCYLLKFHVSFFNAMLAHCHTVVYFGTKKVLETFENGKLHLVKKKITSNYHSNKKTITRRKNYNMEMEYYLIMLIAPFWFLLSALQRHVLHYVASLETRGDQIVKIQGF